MYTEEEKRLKYNEYMRNYRAKHKHNQAYIDKCKEIRDRSALKKRKEGRCYCLSHVTNKEKLKDLLSEQVFPIYYK